MEMQGSAAGPPVILADDLTGACDIAGCFLSAAGAVDVLCSWRGAELRPPGLCVLNTQTRTVPVKESAEILARVGGRVAGADLIFKKIDSGLRGSLGAEIEILARAAKRRCVLVAPSIPSIGRTTLGGMQLQDGTPVNMTEYARDPTNPVGSSHVARVLAQTSSLAAVHIGPQEVGDFCGEVAVVDSCSDGDLDAAVQGALKKERVLLVGSVGLGAALGRALAWDRPGPTGTELSAVPCGRAAEPAMVVSGTRYERSRLQIEKACAVFGAGRVAIDLPCSPTQARQISTRAGETGTSVLTIGAVTCREGEILNQLARAVRHIVSLNGPCNLGVIGGDTAYHVLGALGAYAITVRGTVESVVSLSTVREGLCDGKALACKGGSVGGPDAVIKMIRYLQGGLQR